MCESERKRERERESKRMNEWKERYMYIIL